ncbi:hypothetical protein DIPPA_17235 [Diplonema papillatum]|nr:hypothetical protein DIPPA_17235 [Diplonema papillatum]
MYATVRDTTVNSPTIPTRATAVAGLNSAADSRTDTNPFPTVPRAARLNAKIRTTCGVSPGEISPAASHAQVAAASPPPLGAVHGCREAVELWAQSSACARSPGESVTRTVAPRPGLAEADRWNEASTVWSAPVRIDGLAAGAAVSKLNNPRTYTAGVSSTAAKFSPPTVTAAPSGPSVVAAGVKNK